MVVTIEPFPIERYKIKPDRTAVVQDAVCVVSEAARR
jgi:hypothetical protein